MGILISPSILAADFVNLQRDLRAIEGADWVHVDVMDGHFVPNLTLGLPVLERIAEVSLLPVDAHLMIEDPDRWAPRYAEAGASSVTFHLEAASDPRAIARDLRAIGARAGVAIKPGTDVEDVLEYVGDVDMILIMTVEPGFGGQRFMADMLPKFRSVKAAAARAGADVWIQVDGGISRSTIEQVVDAGADMIVAGSAVYGATDPGAEIAALRRMAEAAHHH